MPAFPHRYRVAAHGRPDGDVEVTPGRALEKAEHACLVSNSLIA